MNRVVSSPSGTPASKRKSGSAAGLQAKGSRSKVAPTVTPSSSTPKSARGKGQEAILVMRKAVQRAAQKDVPGMFSPPPSDFVVLDKVSNAFLLEVDSECGFDFSPMISSPSMILSLVRSKELAQADIAEAAAKTAEALAAKKR